mmetsp:Transcript_47557/g.76639  ORF Transcript_47557/g.76639 Transcript_47557/m.76639 type:complete len:80 (-) Transcript_47557:175-414(-)
MRNCWLPPSSACWLVQKIRASDQSSILTQVYGEFPAGISANCKPAWQGSLECGGSTRLSSGTVGLLLACVAAFVVLVTA